MKLFKVLCIVLGFCLLQTISFSQNKWTITEICVPTNHIDSCNIKLPFMDIRSIESEILLDLILGDDTTSNCRMIVNTKQEVITKIRIKVKGNKVGEKLMEAIAEKFTKPQLVNHNLVVNIYLWEFPEGVVNYLEYNKLTQKCLFVSAVK